MNRQKLILTVLLALLGVSSLQFFPDASPKTGLRSRSSSTTAARVTAVPRKAVSPPAAQQRVDERKLRLDLLDATPPPFAGFRRNIFQPIFREEAKPSKLPLPAPPVRPALPKPPPPPPAVPVPPAAPAPTPVQQEMARFTFLGFLKKDNQKTIFLSSSNEIFLVKKGDKIAGKYEVTNITDEALTIHVLADGSEIIIPLVENKPLSAPRR